MARLSLRSRMMILALCVEAATLAGFAAIVHHRARSQLIDSLDDMLRTQAKTLASMVGVDSKGRLTWLRGSQGAIRRFQRLRRDDVFEIVLPDGRVLMRSPGLGDEPLAMPWSVAERLGPGESHSYTVVWRGEPYRARCLRVVARSNPKAPGGERSDEEFFVIYAQRLKSLKGRLVDLLEYMTYLGAAVLLVSAGALWLLSRVGLLPVARLSREVASVGPDNLQYRLDVEHLPPDLRTLGLAINGFLERLEKAFSREKQFAADAAHELCTPIASMKSDIQTALLDPSRSAEDRAALEDLLRDVERLEHIADSLLTLSEADSGRLGGDRHERIELRGFLESLLTRFEQAAAGCGVSVEIEPGDNVTIRVNADALELILSNLIDNAIKHNRPGGKVWISLGATADGCEIRVADDGPGIPDSDVPYLFERFFRVDKSRSRERGGAGLGLAIAKSLCESQGATIGYEHRRGGGSVFVVRFRCA